MALRDEKGRRIFKLSHTEQEMDLIRLLADENNMTQREWLNEELLKFAAEIIPMPIENSLFSNCIIRPTKFAMPIELEAYYSLLEDRHGKPLAYLVRKFITDPALIDHYRKTGGF